MLSTTRYRNRGVISLPDGTVFIVVKWCEMPKIQHIVALYTSTRGDGKHALAVYVDGFVGTTKVYEKQKPEQVKKAYNNVVEVVRKHNKRSST